ncbi:hypothetical protein PCASD_09809 [Puccinia coronata f. sp. avenae]|uniref:Uncharacterized protein n=1 Tax=Puccinia coronata f. sp. avenae TaxID=200324 RepID=A0A2N5U9Z7_9BASI|nr:hypothetical protein PCASD_09809 [Puccinia coronata f. sp. avenae]
MAPTTTTHMSNTLLIRRDDEPGKQDSKPGAATYYGAIVIVVFIVLALSVVVRILYTRRARRRRRHMDHPDQLAQEQEERLAMQRRDEETGLPTYRESTILPNEDTVLAATPMTDTPFVQDSTTATLERSTEDVTRASPASLPPEDSDQPPKYEDHPTDTPATQPHLHPPTLDITNEMRMSSLSTATLLLPSINISEPDADDTPPNQSHQPDQPSSTPSSPSPSLPQPPPPPPDPTA